MVDAHAVLCYNDILNIAGWSSLVARWAHNPKVVGSNPTPATIENKGLTENRRSFFQFSGENLLRNSLGGF